MKITIVSDIHADVQESRGYNYSNLYNKLYESDFLVVAGDISGDAFRTEDWLDNYMNKGIAIEGNHLGYNDVSVVENNNFSTKNGYIDYLKDKYDGSNGKKFLENDTYEIDGVLFIGCTLYTDFELHGNAELSMNFARNSMNDYYYVHYLSDGKKLKLNPYVTSMWHRKSVEFIDATCAANRDKKIVIVSHHAPSGNSIGKKYTHDTLNPAYASNLEWLMEKYDNLVLWVHGHVHEDFDYTVHGTRVVCYPFGYINENNRTEETIGLTIDLDEM